MKIVRNEEETKRRIKFNKLVDIARETLPGYKISESANYFTMHPQAQIDIAGFFVRFFPEKNALFVYEGILLPDAKRLANAYEDYEKSEGNPNNQYTIHACF